MQMQQQEEALKRFEKLIKGDDFLFCVYIQFENKALVQNLCFRPMQQLEVWMLFECFCC